MKCYKNLGKVHLTLEFDNGEFDFEVSVPQASFIQAFDDTVRPQ